MKTDTGACGPSLHTHIHIYTRCISHIVLLIGEITMCPSFRGPGKGCGLAGRGGPQVSRARIQSGCGWGCDLARKSKTGDDPLGALTWLLADPDLLKGPWPNASPSTLPHGLFTAWQATSIRVTNARPMHYRSHGVAIT